MLIAPLMCVVLAKVPRGSPATWVPVVGAGRRTGDWVCRANSGSALPSYDPPIVAGKVRVKRGANSPSTGRCAAGTRDDNITRRRAPSPVGGKSGGGCSQT